MKQLPVIAAFFAAASVVALAQETAPTPVAEVGMTFSSTMSYPKGGAPWFSSLGGSGTFVYNFSRMFGVVADLGGYHNGDDVNFNPTTFSYLFGPRISLRRSSRSTPYVQALVGGTRVSTSLLDPNSGNAITENGLTQAYGGGLDIRLTDHVALKPFQVEYLVTRLPNIWSANDFQNNMRYSAGVVFRFGSK